MQSSISLLCVSKKIVFIDCTMKCRREKEGRSKKDQGAPVEKEDCLLHRENDDEENEVRKAEQQQQDEGEQEHEMTLV